MAVEAQKENPNLSAIKLLGSMCFDRDQSLATVAAKSLYKKIIIPLCDDFTSQGVHVTNLILATLIIQDANCINPESKDALHQAGITSATDLLTRLKRIQHKIPIPRQQQKQIKKICILSRVTIGADIRITSILIQRLHTHFPKAKITLIGPGHLPQLFKQPFLNHKLFKYERDHNTPSRLHHWLQLKQMIDAEWSHLKEEDFLLIDPDTRLSQLGLLPLAPEKSTRILPSRVDQTAPNSLITITNKWLDCILGKNGQATPKTDINTISTTTKNKSFTIVLNFGVGNDQGKRLYLQFEQELILAFLKLKNTKIILDSGAGPFETNEAKAIEDYFNQQHPDHLPSFTRIQGSIASLAEQIASADLFIGYDSCSGHIATTYDTPTIICFKGSPNQRFRQRWQPANHFKTTSCLDIEQKELNGEERSLLISRIIDIASSHYQTFQ